MLPAFVSTQDFDFHAQEINGHLQIRLCETRHAHRVLFGGDNHGKVAAETAIDEADQFSFGVVMMINVAFRQIYMRTQFGKRALKTFRGSNRAERTDERVAQSLKRQLLTGKHILQVKRFMRTFDNFCRSIVTPDTSHQLEISVSGILGNKDVAGTAKI